MRDMVVVHPHNPQGILVVVEEVQVVLVEMVFLTTVEMVGQV